jgi:hypothetical protein
MPMASVGGLFRIRVARIIDATGVGNVPTGVGNPDGTPGNVVAKNSAAAVPAIGTTQPVFIRSTESLW